jgi:hypothetical protein
LEILELAEIDKAHVRVIPLGPVRLDDVFEH